MDGYPAALEITPLERPPQAVVNVPGSKSITNRALVLAALAARESGCTLDRILHSEDTEVMLAALRTLGFPVKVKVQVVKGCTDRFVHFGPAERDRLIPAHSADLFVGNSGTTMRFLTALLSLGQGRYRLDGVERMRERPIEDLLAALRQLGVETYSERDNGCPPVILNANGLRGGRVIMRGDVSSQFLSGLLMAAPLAEGDVELVIEGPLVSQPYVAMTVELMRLFGARVTVADNWKRFQVRAGQHYHLTRFVIEPDASAAGYFFAAAAIAGGETWVTGLTSGSLQGDLAFLDILAAMGCEVFRGEAGIKVRGGTLKGVDVDMNGISDCAMTLGAVACFAEGPTTIRNVAHIRHKETDRIAALATELRRVGAEVEELPDGLTVTPAPLHGAAIETYDDHRIAMSMALIGLRVPGIIIKNPGCVAKTYPRFFEDFNRLRRS